MNIGVESAQKKSKATVYGYYVNEPQRYGVVLFDEQQNVISIEEKPSNPKSNFAITGLYFYPNNVLKKAEEVKPSKRGELEITSINNMYLSEKNLKVEIMGRGYTWLDTGTPESLLEASTFIEAIEKRQGLKVACIEEIAFQKGYISETQLLNLAKLIKNENYSRYLSKLTEKESEN